MPSNVVIALATFASYFAAMWLLFMVKRTEVTRGIQLGCLVFGFIATGVQLSLTIYQFHLASQIGHANPAAEANPRPEPVSPGEIAPTSNVEAK